MARKLKTYQTSLGFFEQAIAAPSMKAALEAWGADSNLFHQGAAKESTDPDIVAATMAKPGVILKRAVGSDGTFSEHADQPKNIGDGGQSTKGARKHTPKSKQAPVRPGKGTDRKAARAYELERQRREREQAKEEAARQKQSERRQQAVAKTQAALNKAEREHFKKAGAIRDRAAALEKMSQAEEARWEQERLQLEGALRRARG